MFTKEIDIKNIYRQSEDKKTVYIDIHIDYYREIYNEWDFSPFFNRDLDSDLFQYLEGCAQEIPKNFKLNITFHLAEEKKNSEKEENSIIGYKNYFRYSLRKLSLKKNNNRRDILFYGLIGFILLFLSFAVDKFSNIIVINRFIIEGFYIGGWVLFWELFSIIFFKQREINEKHRVLKRLMNSTITYSYDIKKHMNNNNFKR